MHQLIEGKLAALKPSVQIVFKEAAGRFATTDQLLADNTDLFIKNSVKAIERRKVWIDADGDFQGRDNGRIYLADHMDRIFGATLPAGR